MTRVTCVLFWRLIDVFEQGVGGNWHTLPGRVLPVEILTCLDYYIIKT